MTQKFVAIAAQEDCSFALSEGGHRWKWGYFGGLNACGVEECTHDEVPECSWRYAAEGAGNGWGKCAVG